MLQNSQVVFDGVGCGIKGSWILSPRGLPPPAGILATASRGWQGISSQQHALDSPVTRLLDEVLHPSLAEDVARHLDHDVVRRGAGVGIVALEPLQAGWA